MDGGQIGRWPAVCVCCGSSQLTLMPVLWPELIDAWRLSDHQVEYINRQQGLHCVQCRCSLRAMALARAIMRCYGYSGLFRDFVRERRIQRLRLLEINAAGFLTQFLARAAGHILVAYPAVDMMAMPFADATFDLVVHSDTLEHLTDPTRGLAECYRVLKPGGFCAFTVPMVVERLTLSREGMPPSYHNTPEERGADQMVRTEYGADAWRQVVEVGFDECRIFSLEYPACQAFVGVKMAR